MTTRRIKEIDRVAMEITNNNFEGVLDTKGHDELSVFQVILIRCLTNFEKK